MPTVRAYEPRVENAPLPAVRGTAALTPEAAGSTIGAGVARAALMYYEDEVQRQDQVAFLEADRKLSEWEINALHHPETGALAKLGKDAFGLPDTVGKGFQETAAQLRGGLTNKRQQLAFDRAVESRRREMNMKLSQHVFIQARKFEETETENYVKNATQAYVLGGDSVELERAQAAVVGFTRRNGLGAEYQKQKLAQVVSDAHVGRIDRFLAQGQDRMAADYFKTNKLAFAGDDIAKVEARLKTATIEGEGLRGAIDVWDRLGPKTDLDPVNLDAMIKDAEGKFADNMPVLKQVKQTLTERANTHNAAQRERSEANLSKIWDAIDAGATIATLPRLVEWRNLTGGQRDTIKQALTQRAEHRADRAYMLSKRAEGEGDDALFYQRLTEASSTPLQEAFLQRNLLDDRAKLSRTQFNHLAEIQASLRKGDTKNADKLLASDRQQDRMVSEALLRMKLDPTPNEKTPKEKVERIVGFKRAVREAVSAIELRTGKPATDADVQSIVDGFVIEAVTKPGILWDDTKRVYQVEPGEQIIIRATDVPKAERTKIEDALRRAGRAITDQAVTQLYTQRLYQMRRVAPPGVSGTIRR